MRKNAWKELAAMLVEMEQAKARLAELAARLCDEDCVCCFCLDLHRAAKHVTQAVSALAEAVDAERDAQQFTIRNEETGEVLGPFSSERAAQAAAEKAWLPDDLL